MYKQQLSVRPLEIFCNQLLKKIRITLREICRHKNKKNNQSFSKIFETGLFQSTYE